MKLGLLLGVLREGLKLWTNKESRKYLDQVNALEKKYYDELAKNEDDRSQLLLDQCLLELNRVAENFIKYAGEK